MSTFYVDTSALVKYYIDEIGSDWLRHLFDSTPEPALLCSQLLVAEVTSAFSRRLRQGTIDATTARDLQNAFHQDCLFKYTLQALDWPIINLAATLLSRHPLRTLDARNRPTALTANQVLIDASLPSLSFIGADNRLNTAATAEGLRVDNPNLHP